MPADASIFSQIQPVRPRNMLADFANVAQIQGLQQRQQLGAMQMDDMRRARAQEEALSGAYRNALMPDGTINRNALFSGVAQAGQGHKLPGIQESFAKSDKAKVEAEKERLALAREKVGFVGQLLGSVKDQATYDAARQTAQANGLPVDNMPPQFDPAFIEAKRQETLTVAQQLEQKWKQMEFTTPNANARLSAETSTANNQRSVSASMANAAATRDVAAATREAGLVEKRLKIDEMQGKAEDRRRQKQGHEASIAAQIGVIDKALSHPGRETATGLSGTLNPSNFVPGTDATDFRVVLDQIGGTAFLQAFESLKGGGQITEVEGKKATEAMARLNRAQSDKEFERSLRDLREVMTAGFKRASGRDFDKSPPAGGGKPVAAQEVPRVASDAEYAALPSGSEFLDPQGNRRRKP